MLPPLTRMHPCQLSSPTLGLKFDPQKGSGSHGSWFLVKNQGVNWNRWFSSSMGCQPNAKRLTRQLGGQLCATFEAESDSAGVLSFFEDGVWRLNSLGFLAL